ncbi:MAG: hypothetical protein AAF763_17445 [Pseudomonadota bacterium]
MVVLSRGLTTARFVIVGPISTATPSRLISRAPVILARPGDSAVMHDLSSQTQAQMRALIEVAGAELRFLLPHGLRLDPIETAFAKPKALQG